METTQTVPKEHIHERFVERAVGFLVLEFCGNDKSERPLHRNDCGTTTPHSTAATPQGLVLCSHDTLAIRTLWLVPVDVHSTPEQYGGGKQNTTTELDTQGQVASSGCWHHHGWNNIQKEIVEVVQNVSH